MPGGGSGREGILAVRPSMSATVDNNRVPDSMKVSLEKEVVQKT